MKPKSKNPKFTRKKKWVSEVEEIELLESWIEFGKADSGSNPLSIKPLSKDEPIGKLNDDNSLFSNYVGCKKFVQYPISQKTKDGLAEGKFKVTTDIQRASLPHTLCGRDILVFYRINSWKELRVIFDIRVWKNCRVLEKLYRARWGPEDGVGCIIITPTRELAGQIFEVLNLVGKRHGFSAGLLIGGRKDVEVEKESVNDMNILVCTPGRLLQHMDETHDFDCSQLQVLVLDEADRILDVGFKQALNAIISQLPKKRQTLLFSATQTKSIQDLARLSLKDPEYISVHKEDVTATPSRLQQTIMIVPLDQKLDMLWSFIKAHLNSKILVFLSTCKQVKFVFEAFKKLRPGIPLKCLHGRMKQEVRMVIYSQFCEKRTVLFSTDVASRGLDFNKAVDWVVQVDCPDDTASYIHRVGRTARYHSGGRSVLFLTPSEEVMLQKLESAKVPVQLIKANTKRLQSVSGLLASLLVKYPTMQALGERAFITYLRSIHKQRDKEVFDVMKLPIEEFSASLGLPMTPKVRFLDRKRRDGTVSEIAPQPKIAVEIIKAKTTVELADPKQSEEEMEEAFLLEKEAEMGEGNGAENELTAVPATRILKKKKLKINIHRPVGTRVVFDEEGNTLAPLAAFANTDNINSGNDLVRLDIVQDRFKKLKEDMKNRDIEDKRLHKKRLEKMRLKAKMKLKRGAQASSESDDEETEERRAKKPKIYFDSDNEDVHLPKMNFRSLIWSYMVLKETIVLTTYNALPLERFVS
ncbi:Atp-dependent rna helicase dbp4 [Thalictrum thalictroides]|uniref:ATP-dependent RNA helicase n=1 Tax=Thalictrum thalictroides TaxID=46969 RepID=A0A7J6V0W2_THATH|nr:Atp-dependent rna helicase dbp4 [Thalictrum thalictroides]